MHCIGELMLPMADVVGLEVRLEDVVPGARDRGHHPVASRSR
jgi:hypothetical protein